MDSWQQQRDCLLAKVTAFTLYLDFTPRPVLQVSQLPFHSLPLFAFFLEQPVWGFSLHVVLLTELCRQTQNRGTRKCGLEPCPALCDKHRELRQFPSVSPFRQHKKVFLSFWTEMNKGERVIQEDILSCSALGLQPCSAGSAVCLATANTFLWLTCTRQAPQWGSSSKICSVPAKVVPAHSCQVNAAWADVPDTEIIH